MGDFLLFWASIRSQPAGPSLVSGVFDIFLHVATCQVQWAVIYDLSFLPEMHSNHNDAVGNI